MAFLYALIEAVFGHLLGQELAARWPNFIRTLVRVAVARLPEFHRVAKEEEWLSTVADLPGPITKLAHCIDLVRGACWIAFREHEIANRRDWLIAAGTMQVLAAVGGVWVFGRAGKWALVKHSRTLKWAEVSLLTFMVQGFSKHAEAYLLAADRFIELGNSDMATESKTAGDKIATNASIT